MKSDFSITRRCFIKQSVAGVTAAAIAPMIIPSGVLAANGQPGANDRIGIGAIGVGRQGGGLLDWLLRLKDARMVAVADVDMRRARDWGKKLGAEPYQDYRKLLERKDVDAIMTATPEQWRSLICIHACQAGKDIYAEKPMSLTIREGRLIAQAVQKYNRVFQTGSQQRSMEVNRRGCELIRNGRIGKIKKVIACNYPSPWKGALPEQKAPEELNWDMWIGPAEFYPYHVDLFTSRANPGWLSFRPFSGGEMTGWGSHGFDQVQWALGFDSTGPLEVWTEGEKLELPTYAKPESRERGDGICRQPKVLFRYPGDIIMELGDGPPGGAIFIGEKGKLTIDRGICRSEPEEIAEEPIKSTDIRLYKSNNHQQNWLDCIKTRKMTIAGVETGHRTATVCHLANIARLLGRRLKWDAEKEVFINDAEANTYLDRERRKPYELPETI